MGRIYILGAAFAMVFVLVLAVYVPLQEVDLAETIEIPSEEIVRVKLNIPSDHRYRSTDNPEKIRELLDFLDDFQYESLVGNETAYIPSRASIIYFYNDSGESDFIVPYVREVMINQIFYKVKDGEIEADWLVGFYESL
ncbi:hypothetical protein JNUCC1_01000 [Lentibacillus sp. JNUCC-1]|uniref:hypothetical protein n=1 Tax=Lentibacillus sp. JNUCC-1 TaxID=2654513 RepID=UPI0012E901B7|nr:hypothetical protein [Lentibacillus sp. JNUCC-1]MUV37194.1 hypothetical protein [Lentibacillus sp. JNUCC-1]